jgi:phosphoribosylamine--glycine ligase
MKTNNPGIASLAEGTRIGRYNDLEAIIAFAKEAKIDFAVVGPEDPLGHGVVDVLEAAGVPAVGPTKALARLETSKSFTRNLLEKYRIPGNPRFRNFTSLDGVEAFFEDLTGIVLKPDGLTGGKGVLVQGDHFETPAEALDHCRAIFKDHPGLTVEEKLEGEEFSLQCFSDGRTVVATPPVQTISGALPATAARHRRDGVLLLCRPSSCPFWTPMPSPRAWRSRGRSPRRSGRKPASLTGGYVRRVHDHRLWSQLIEYNARLGDPEAMNILPLLKTDFIDLCQAILWEGLTALTSPSIGRRRCASMLSRRVTACPRIIPRPPPPRPGSRSARCRGPGSTTPPSTDGVTASI